MDIIFTGILIICYSLVLGVIAAQVFLTTPIVFKVLDDLNASAFLRKIFPRYYFLLLLILLVASLVSYLFFTSIDFKIALATATIALLGIIIIPITNLARDRGWDNIFKGLHSLSIFNTVIIFIISIVQVFRIINAT